MVIRDDGVGERLVEEISVPTEAALHEVLMRHPELVPATDLGFGRVATVGFEASLSSGSADLILLDEQGRLCIVEVKKEGNPDTRRVVAQLLDYAASLWGLTVEDFDETIVQRDSGAENVRSLRDVILEDLLADADDPDHELKDLLKRLGEMLRTGDFTLVLAAPTVPDGVRRVIEYLNARGSSVYGLEISYFAGTVKAFVPRLVVRPTFGRAYRGARRTHQPRRHRREVVLPATAGRGPRCGRRLRGPCPSTRRGNRLATVRTPCPCARLRGTQSHHHIRPERSVADRRTPERTRLGRARGDRWPHREPHGRIGRDRLRLASMAVGRHQQSPNPPG